jgi:tRNA (guanine-N7-)-methyltransferase
MGRKNKLRRFAEMRQFPNCFQNFSFESPDLLGTDGTRADLRGKWSSAHFGNNHPLTLELACGGGEYTVHLAAMYPDRNFIGIDIKGARMYKGARKALEAGCLNAAFVRTRIEKLESFFAHGEVDEIWITFPDPFLKESRANRRLTAPPFLRRYEGVLKKGGILHLKTDESELFDFTVDVINGEDRWELLAAYDDIYSGPMLLPEWSIKTHYELLHLGLGKTIKYLCARLKEA